MARPEILTERLRLRHFVPADRDEIIDILSRWEVVSNLSRWPHPLDTDMVDDLIKRHEKEPTGGFGIDLNGTVIGMIGTGPKIGFLLHPDHWGMGYMPEALMAVQDYGLSTLGHEAMLGDVLIDNLGSIRVFEKCGWREVAAGRCYSRARDEMVPSRNFVHARRLDWLDPIETERLVLRPIGPEDADAIWPIVSDRATVNMLLTWPWPPDREHLVARLSGVAARAGLLSAITHKGATIGFIGCTGGSLFYALHPDFRGAGFATEAARGKIERAFADPTVDRLIAGTWDDNPASVVILKRLGFVQTGHDTMFHPARGADASGPDFELTRANWRNAH